MQKKLVVMVIIEIIRHKMQKFCEEAILCKQWPIHTHFSRKEYQNNGALEFAYMIHHTTEKDSKRISKNKTPSHLHFLRAS